MNVDVEIRESTKAAMHDLYYSLNDEEYMALVRQMIFRAEDLERVIYILYGVGALLAQQAVDTNSDSIELKQKFEYRGKRYEVTNEIKVTEVE